jgi:hypothetical protein
MDYPCGGFKKAFLAYPSHGETPQNKVMYEYKTLT